MSQAKRILPIYQYLKGKRTILTGKMIALHISVRNKMKLSRAAIVALCFVNRESLVNREISLEFNLKLPASLAHSIIVPSDKNSKTCTSLGNGIVFISRWN